MTDTAGAALKLFVKRLLTRSVLTQEEAEAILGLKGELREIRAHQDFVRLGEPVDHSCLIVDGLVGRFGQNGEGVRQITCFHIAGDMADLASVMSPKSGWGLSTTTRSELLRLPHTELRRIAAAHPGVAEAFWRDCVADGSIFSEWVVNMGRRDSLTRLAHLFCEMAIRSELAGLGDRKSYPLQATQADLGDATGMTDVHLNRTLKELKARSVLTARAGTVTIDDWDQLVSIGEFDDRFMLLDGPAPRVFAQA